MTSVLLFALVISLANGGRDGGCVNDIDVGFEARFAFESSLVVSHVAPLRNGSLALVAKHSERRSTRRIALSALDVLRGADDNGGDLLLLGVRPLHETERWPLLFTQTCGGAIRRVFSTAPATTATAAASSSSSSSHADAAERSVERDWEQQQRERRPGAPRLVHDADAELVRDLGALLTLCSVDALDVALRAPAPATTSTVDEQHFESLETGSFA